MKFYSSVCAALAFVVLHLARIALASLGLIVLYGVTMRYAFHNAPPYMEQVALMLVISVAMLGAAAGAREGGHIGLDSVMKLLPTQLQKIFSTMVDLLTLTFASVILWGSLQMAISTQHDHIPTLGISEAWRYLPVIVAGILIFLFAIEHLLELWAGLSRTPTDQSSHSGTQPSSPVSSRS